MLQGPPRGKEWASWLFAGLWSIIIFVTIPAARTLQEFVEARWGGEIFTYLVILTIIIAGVVAVTHLLRLRAASRSGYIWILVVLGIFVGYTIELRNYPEEAVHFVQYGLLGLLVYRALSHRIRDVSIYFSAAIISATVGILDEAIQWIAPLRFWGLHDIWLNFFAGSLIQLAIAKGLTPTIISGPPAASSVRLFCRLSAGALLLLGASLINTPARIAWYTDRIPVLAFLKTNLSVMAEYGYLYVDPAIGTFRSRFSPTKLREIDANRGTEAARILDRFRGDETVYWDFLQKYTPVNDPFVHEARVHLFRRDRYLTKSEKFPHDKKTHRYYLTVAFRENAIMEKYFSSTLHYSAYNLRGEQVTFLKENQLSDLEYESPVGQALFTRIREWQLVGALGLAMLGLTVANHFYGRDRAAEVSS